MGVFPELHDSFTVLFRKPKNYSGFIIDVEMITGKLIENSYLANRVNANLPVASFGDEL